MADEMQRSSAKERGRRLRLVRKMSGLTLDELSSKYNLGISTIKYWECAKNQGLSSKGAKKIVTAMQKEGVQCSYMWLMHGVGLPPQFISILYHQGNHNHDVVNLNAFEEERSIEREVKLFCEGVMDAISLTIFDDGMEPFYSLGDSIGGKRLYGTDLTKAVGKNCIVETLENQVLCRRVAEGNGIENFNLCCINSNTLANPPHLYDVKLKSAAPITRVWKRVIF